MLRMMLWMPDTLLQWHCIWQHIAHGRRRLAKKHKQTTHAWRTRQQSKEIWGFAAFPLVSHLKLHHFARIYQHFQLTVWVRSTKKKHHNTQSNTDRYSSNRQPYNKNVGMCCFKANLSPPVTTPLQKSICLVAKISCMNWQPGTTGIYQLQVLVT